MFELQQKASCLGWVGFIFGFYFNSGLILFSGGFSFVQVKRVSQRRSLKRKEGQVPLPLTAPALVSVSVLSLP